jgi:hypothetical protein
MECGSVEMDECYFKVLEEKLNDNCDIGKSFEVVNLGVGSYAIDNEYLLYRDLGKRFDPDMVILGFYWNDFHQSIAELDEEGNVSFRKTSKVRFYSIRSFLGRKSHAYNFVGRIIFLAIKERVKTDIYGFTPDEDYPRLLELYEKVFNLLKQEVLNDRRSLVVLVVPDKHEVDKFKYQQYIEKIGIPTVHPQVRSDILEFFEKNSDLVIDPLGVLKQLNQNNDFYYDIDGHWNKLGHNTAASYSANAICKYLTE